MPFRDRYVSAIANGTAVDENLPDDGRKDRYFMGLIYMTRYGEGYMVHVNGIMKRNETLEQT